MEDVHTCPGLKAAFQVALNSFIALLKGRVWWSQKRPEKQLQVSRYLHS